MSVPLHNMYVPVPTGIHTRLRAEAKRSGQPTTVLVRKAIEAWLEKREKDAQYQAITRYARESAGTPADLDPNLESAAAKHLFDDERG